MWWSMVNTIAGKSTNTTVISFADKPGNAITDTILAAQLNDYFISVMSDVAHLDTSALPAFLPALEQPPTIHPVQVCKKFLGLSPFKSPGADGIPNRILKEFAHELAEPVARIFNCSMFSGCFPTIWKDSLISPTPKVTPVTGDGDLRPIARTPCISKVLEDFVVLWLIDDVIRKSQRVIYNILSFRHDP